MKDEMGNDSASLLDLKATFRLAVYNNAILLCYILRSGYLVAGVLHCLVIVIVQMLHLFVNFDN